MKITQHKTSELFPYINNAREHSEAQVTQIASSIREFGFTNPLLIDDDGGIIAGHGRLMAAKKLEMDEVPCIVLSGLSEAKKKALILADNKLALNATWDEELLKLELESLAEMDVNIGLTGFSSDELDGLLENIETDLPKIDDRDENHLHSVTFILSTEQEATVKEALKIAQKNDLHDEFNQNKNGNAIAQICEVFLSGC